MRLTLSLIIIMPGKRERFLVGVSALIKVLFGYFYKSCIHLSTGIIKCLIQNVLA